MQITLNVSANLARKLGPIRSRIPQILDSVTQDPAGEPDPWLPEVMDVFKKLITSDTPKQVLAIRASKPLQRRISELLAKNKDEGLTVKERREMDRYLYLEELVQLAKARALPPARKNGR